MKLKEIDICELIKTQVKKHPCKYYKNKNDDKTQCVLCVYHASVGGILNSLDFNIPEGNLKGKTKVNLS